MKEFTKGCYRIAQAEGGDVTLQLDEDYMSPENLCAAALEFLHEQPEYYLGTWIDHPDIKNVLYTIFSSEGRAVLRFHSKASIANHPPVDGYVYLDHATFDNALQTMVRAALDIHQAATRED